MSARPAAIPETPEAIQVLEAERAILGLVLVDPEALACATLRVDDFAGSAHRTVWEAVLKLQADGSPVDLVTVQAELGRRRELQSVGGSAFLASLTDALPRIARGASAAHVEGWAKLVREAAGTRSVITMAERLLARARAGETGHDLVEEAFADLAGVASRVCGEVDLDTQGPIALAVESLLARSQGDRRGGHSTGWVDIDRKVGLPEPGQLWMVGGGTSTGKSTLLVNMGEAIAATGAGVLLFSGEMPVRQINERRLCATARVSRNLFKPHGVTPLPRDNAAIEEAGATLGPRPFYVEAAKPTPAEMRAKARWVMATRGLQVVIVDYLQLFPAGPGRKGESRAEEVGRISRALKQMAMDLDVIVLAAVQINRGPEAEGKRRAPRITDLRDSGCLEQDADVVLLLWQEREDATDTQVIVGKNRDGERGTVVRLRLEGAQHRFDNLAWGDE